jgi:virginiamycin A acetyltransferase
MLFSNILYKLYGVESRILRHNIIRIINKLDGGEMRSMLLRRIFKDYFGVEIGQYTHGGCFHPGSVAPGTTIGRYCSISRTVKIFNRYHPMEFKSMHGFFFNPILKLCDKYLVDTIPLKIGNDVWIGEYAVILARVTEIGDGAVIGAGTVVNKNVPPYAVVIGNPGRVVRYRFSKETIDELLASRWWEKDIEHLKENIEEFQQPYEKLCSEGRSNIEMKI